jgi:CBS domain containing-hemolysin-like protein
LLCGLLSINGRIFSKVSLILKLTDKVEYAGYRFEVIDMEMNRIDQILVTKLPITKEDPD